jgi:hypothetical protein
MMTVHPHANPLMRPAQRVTRRLVTRLATAGHQASDFAAEEDLADLPARLDQIDAWIDQELLNGGQLNAADFQIAPNIALLMRFEDLAPDIQHRPAAKLARRLLPDDAVQIGAALPAQWLAAVRSSPRHGSDGTRSGSSP